MRVEVRLRVRVRGRGRLTSPALLDWPVAPVQLARKSRPPMRSAARTGAIGPKSWPESSTNLGVRGVRVRARARVRVRVRVLGFALA